ncbi:FAD/NAD(P)-binding domain-containing protein [Cyberlindnera jadinii NRRL Y-1542]|uniref:FAD/NAD(P)-binding domain-containing protein n=1 Tax=Cyberlindnera jadinii (strain ATCC 18201 / CBS 1600 / BCRC 20928 / JCM 3617 / NBRC 0987 / NRRL Y-1542) TaxID=983966 RepID=A0A1E4S5M0_CYBJN|nr:FAD/NAD(P)-binding domain-containing protein [Cyberlindnera jadinii NRRL Y-1542]ODV74808.1 FAD/NAD(P)-binding domain-containing protein [Cyberlindnera jadinii NRRL Y-1542]
MTETQDGPIVFPKSDALVSANNALPNISKIAVIGSGPCGAAITKALLAEKKFTKIDVFERRPTLGGLWNYTPLKTQIDPTSPVPSVDPNRVIEKVKVSSEEFYESPVYKFLDANVPKTLMAYNDNPFPADDALFPTHEQILKYIVGYSKDIEDYVQFNTSVTELVPDGEGWALTSQSSITGEVKTGKYDAVCIAVGNYDQPFIPEVEGLRDWNTKYPGSVIHAKSYDEPDQFKESRNILVVGNSASGADIAFQLASYLNRTIYKSVRSENTLPAGKSDLIKDVPDLDHFDAENKTVYFKDGSSIDKVDSVIFCTGYLKSIPFLKSPHLITDGQKIHDLFRHLIYIKNPTLAVIGLPRFVLPTRISESQGCWLARVWAGEISLPSLKDMQKANAETEGDERTHHDLKYPKDIEYANNLNAESRAATGDRGYQAVEWDTEQCKVRASIKPLKEAYIKYLSETHKRAKTIEELEKAGYFKFPETF